MFLECVSVDRDEPDWKFIANDAYRVNDFNEKAINNVPALRF